MQGPSRLVKSPRACRFPIRPKFRPPAAGTTGSWDESAQSNHATIYPCYLERCPAVNDKRKGGVKKNNIRPRTTAAPCPPALIDARTALVRPPSASQSRPFNGPNRPTFESARAAVRPPHAGLRPSWCARVRVALIPRCRAVVHCRGGEAMMVTRITGNQVGPCRWVAFLPWSIGTMLRPSSC
jgi:hypothetical protein